MGVSKVIIGGTTRLDLTQTTATAQDVASGKYFFNINGDLTEGTASGGGGSSMNIQADLQRKARTANSYGDTGLTITVAQTGTYTVSWSAWRSSSSGTMGTNLHVNNTTGTNQQTFTNTYGQQIELTDQHYNAGDILKLYATSGSTSRTLNVCNLVIMQTS